MVSGYILLKFGVELSVNGKYADTLSNPAALKRLDADLVRLRLLLWLEKAWHFNTRLVDRSGS
jgi:hypothetical protein